MTILTSEKRQFFPPYRFIEAGQVMGANLAFTMEALQRIGGMNELLGSGTRFGSNDIEAAASVLWAGLAGAYDPRPTVYHDHGRRTDEAINDLWLQYDEVAEPIMRRFCLGRNRAGPTQRSWHSYGGQIYAF